MNFNLRKILLLILISTSLFFSYSSAMFWMRRKATEFSSKIVNYKEERSTRNMKRKKERFVDEADRISIKVAKETVVLLKRLGYYACDTGYSAFSFIRGNCNYYFRRNPNELENVHKGIGTNFEARGLFKYISRDEDQPNIDYEDEASIICTIGRVLKSFRKKSLRESICGICSSVTDFGGSIFNGGRSMLSFANSTLKASSWLLLAAGGYSYFRQNAPSGKDHMFYGFIGAVLTHYFGKAIKKQN